ncbi:MAG: potassium channel family protein [Candidatus Rokuibacteriota bacterium]
MKHFLVVGLGRFGRAVAEELTEGGGQVIGVDHAMALVDAVRDRVEVAAQIDSVDPETLANVGAADVDAAVVAIGEDFAAEVLSVAVLKELGIKTIVARANTDRERRILELVGATRVTSVEVEMGQRVARSLLGSDLVDHVSLGEGASVVYWTADERVLGKTSAECHFPDKWHLVLVAVRRGAREELRVLPAPDYVFQAGDVLLLAGHDARLQAFTE